MIIRKIEYLGIEKPITIEEIEVEICGLLHAARVAEEMAARLQQSLAIAKMELKNDNKNSGNT